MNPQQEALGAWHLLSSKLEGWVQSAILILPNLVVAVLVMLAFYYGAALTGRVLDRFLPSTNASLNRLIKTFIRLAILFFGLFTALSILNLDKTVASLLAGAGVIGLAIGFAFQEIAANFFSGILIAIRKPYQEGDIIQIESFMGTVSELTLRTTNITTFPGLEVLIPNKDMFTKAVTNFTKTPERRVDLAVGVAYASDLRRVTEIAIKAVDGIEGRLERPAEFYCLSFGDSAINCELRFWVEYPGKNTFTRATHEAVIRIQQAFAENKIEIPFPTRSVEMVPPPERMT